jgi:hypothetical protein
MAQIVAIPVEIGPFFVGNTAPDIQGILTWDTGGYVDLTGATVDFSVQRWDPTRRKRWGPAVSGGACSTFGVRANGEVNYSWSTTPVPNNPGWYAGRFVVTFSDDTVQDSQDCIFEVQEAAAAV